MNWNFKRDALAEKDKCLHRILSTLRKLQHRYGQVTTKDLAEEFNVSSRTILRDLNALDCAGFPLQEIRECERPKVVWRLMEWDA